MRGTCGNCGRPASMLRHEGDLCLTCRSKSKEDQGDRKEHKSLVLEVLVLVLVALPIIALAYAASAHDDYLVELDERQHQADAEIARRALLIEDNFRRIEAALAELADARAAGDDLVGVCLERTDLLRYIIRPLYNRLDASEPPSLLAPWPEVP